MFAPDEVLDVSQRAQATAVQGEAAAAAAEPHSEGVVYFDD
jgi:hypothetical protein